MNKLIAVAVVAVLIALGIVVIPGDGGHKHVQPNGGGTILFLTSANNKRVAVPVTNLKQAASGAEDTHLGNDAATPAQLATSNKANPDGPVVKGNIPLAAGHQRGCLTRSNSVNFSNRNGTRPSLVVLHLTVSPNVGGWNDVNGVWGFLNRSSTQASANYIVDHEGHCILAVSESNKAWAQANYNSATACSVEVINTGNESKYINGGLHQLARVVHDCAKRWHIPLRVGAVGGCGVQRAGVIDHYHLGSCGGGHNDIHNFGKGCRNQGGGAATLLCVKTVIRAARRIK